MRTFFSLIGISLVGALALILTVGSPPTAWTVSVGSREVPVASVEIPFYAPTWAPENPLHSIEGLLESGDTNGAADGLRLCLDDLIESGHLLYPLLPPDRPASAIQRIPGNGETLAEWHAQLRERGAPPLIRPGRELVIERSASAPLYWHPAWRETAEAALEVALARGDLDVVRRLAAPPLSLELAPAVRRTLDDAVTFELTPRPTPRPELPKSWKRRYSIPLELSPAPGDRRMQDSKVPRRVPLSVVRPALLDDRVFLSTGSRLLGLTIGDKPRIFLRKAFLESPFSTLLHYPVSTISDGKSLVALVRNPVKEHAQVNSYGLAKTIPQFHQLRAFAIDGRQLRPIAPGLMDVALDYNVVGEPLILGDRLIFLAVQGWQRLRLDAFSYNLRTDRLEWSRHVGTIGYERTSESDLADVLPCAELHSVGGHLVVVSSLGWIARLEEKTGEYRGTLFYRRNERPRNESSFHKLGRFNYVASPTPRPRYPTRPEWIASDGALAGHLVLLPPDSRDLLAVDLDRWEVVWRHEEVSAQVMLLGSMDNDLLLLDCGVAPDTQQLELRRLDGVTGRMRHQPLQLNLSNGAPLVPGLERFAHLPVLTGVPLLVGKQLWVPTHGGIDMWWVAETAQGERVPDRTLSWPAGSFGGTPVPLSETRVATFSRGDVELGTPSRLEIFEFSSNDE